MSKTSTEIQAVTTSGEIKKTTLETDVVSVSAEQMAELRSRIKELPKMEPGISLDARYFEFENAGDAARGIFLGYKTLRMNAVDGEDQRESVAVAWMDENETVFVNSGVSLVNIFRSANLPPLQSAVEITYTGRKKTANGSVKLYDVRILQ